MKNEKKQPDTRSTVANIPNPGKKAGSALLELTTLKALQEKARLLGRTYQYGGYQGL